MDINFGCLDRGDVLAPQLEVLKLKLYTKIYKRLHFLLLILGTKVEEVFSLQEGIQQFKNLYEEKTGNVWEDRAHFQKLPGRFYPVDVDYGEDMANLEISDKPSKLPKPVQDLVRLIFDVNSMKKVMLEFELDTEKMPLGVYFFLSDFCVF